MAGLTAASGNTMVGASAGRQNLGLVIRGICPGLPEVGKIKIGMKGKMITSKAGNKFQPPQKLDHFRVTTLERGPDGNYKLDQDIHRQLGERPTRIRVRLLYDDPELNFPTRLTCYNGAKLWCAGNNEFAERVNGDGRTKAIVTCPCERIAPDYQGRGKCKYNGVLSVILEDHQRVGGVWKFRTTSYNSVVNILSSLAMIRQITGGKLAGIPLDLAVLPKTVPTPGTGQIQTVYVVGIEYRGSMLALAEEGARHAIAMAAQRDKVANVEQYVKNQLIAYDGHLDTDTDDDIVDEFYPEERVAKGVVTEKQPQAQTSEKPTAPNYGGGLVKDTDGAQESGKVETPAASQPDGDTKEPGPSGEKGPSDQAKTQEKGMLGDAMNIDQLWELLENKMNDSGINAKASREGVIAYIHHIVKVSKTPLEKTIKTALNFWPPFLEGMSRWKMVVDAQTKKEANDRPMDDGDQQQGSMNPAHNGPPEGTRMDGLPVWDEDHPWWPSKWKNVRAGNGKTTGFVVFVKDCAKALGSVPKNVQRDIVDKWSRLYKDVPFPIELPWQDAGSSTASDTEAAESGSGQLSDAEMRTELRQSRVDLVSRKQHDPELFSMAIKNMVGQGRVSNTIPAQMSLDECNTVLDEIKSLGELQGGLKKF
jgi:hypothetical protein